MSENAIDTTQRAAMCCGNCGAYQPVSDPPPADPNGTGFVGRCRRRAPVCLGLVVPPDTRYTHPMEEQGVWPEVTRDDWCMDYVDVRAMVASWATLPVSALGWDSSDGAE